MHKNNGSLPEFITNQFLALNRLIVDRLFHLFLFSLLGVWQSCVFLNAKIISGGHIWHHFLFYSRSHPKCALILQWTASPSSSAELKPNLQKTCLLMTCISTRRPSPSTCQSTNLVRPLHPPPLPPLHHLPLSDPLSPRLLYRRHPRPPPPLHRLSPQPHRCSRQALWFLLEPGWEVSHICTSCILCLRLHPALWACREQGSWPAMFTASQLWYSRCPSCTPLQFDHPPASTTPSCYLCWTRSKARAKVRQCSPNWTDSIFIWLTWALWNFHWTSFINSSQKCWNFKCAAAVI